MAGALAGLVLLGALAVLPAEAAAQTPPPAELTEATIVERGVAVEVWVRLSRQTQYQSEVMDGPHRLVLDFEDTAYRWVRFPVPVVADPIRELRGSQFRKDVARLVIELHRKAAYTIDADREGLRIVIPRAEPQAAKPAPAARPAPTPSVPPTSGGRSLAAPVVYGIIRLDERAHAYIFDPGTRQVRRYAEGDALGDAVVEKIGDRNVVLRTPGGRMELRVEETRPATAPAPADTLTPRGIRPPPAPVGPTPAPRS
jgi:AMIN domain